jgi:hypothetical protein
VLLWLALKKPGHGRIPANECLGLRGVGLQKLKISEFEAGSHRAAHKDRLADRFSGLPDAGRDDLTPGVGLNWK